MTVVEWWRSSWNENQ